MLEKPEFDCTDLGAFYDCGCAEDESEEKEGGEDTMSTEGHSAASRGDGKQDPADLHDHLAVEISKEE
jgi:FAD-linked sulfhydryl oxidase